MLSPLHVGSSGNLESHFEIITDLLFQVVDEQGFFQSTWHLITPAMASSVLTSLMEVVARSSSRPQLMKIFHNMFNKHAQTSSSLNLGIFQLQGMGTNNRFGMVGDCFKQSKHHVNLERQSNITLKTTWKQLCVCVCCMYCNYGYWYWYDIYM